MSRTTNNATSGERNPAKKFLEWSSKDKAWTFWNKETEKREKVEKGVPFIVLDMLNTVSGYDSKAAARIWSNEVRSVKDTFNVHKGDKPWQSGAWSDVKDLKDIKFCKTVYALARIGDEYELVCFKLVGAAVGGWFEFLESIGGDKKVYGDVVVSVSGVEQKQTGSVTFFSPVFSVKGTELSAEAAKLADEADKKLQAYLEGYLSRGGKREEAEPETGSETADEFPEEEEGDDVPF